MRAQGSDKWKSQHVGSPTAGKVAIGHPIDVASGVLFHDFTDYTLPGRFPLAFKRRYSTSLLNIPTPGMLGRGWSTPFEVKLSEEENGYRYLDESGENEIFFPLFEPGERSSQRMLNAGACADLTQIDTEYCVTRWNPDTGEITKDYFPIGDPQQRTTIARRENSESSAIEFQYSESSGLLEYVLQKREQRGFKFRYDKANNLIAILRRSRQSSEQEKRADSDPWLQFDYDEQGMLRVFTDPLGNQSRYSYDAAGQMIREVTLAGKEWRFIYDDQKRCVVATAKNRFDYHKLDYGLESGRVTKVEDSYGNVTRYFYNESGQVEKVISPLGLEKNTVFDGAGRVVQEVNGQGVVVQFGYDELGNRSSFLFADGTVFSYLYDERHLPISYTDATGNIWRRRYDKDGRVVEISNPLSVVEKSVYNRFGDFVEHINAEKDSRRFSWDGFGNVIQSTDWMDNRTSYGWDAYGNINRVVDPNGRVITVRRDKIGRLECVIYPDGARKQYKWDVFDNLSEFVDELGNVTTYQYCDCGNIEVERRPDGSTIHYGWNAIPGQLSALTNQNSDVFHFEYDADGRMIQETDFSGAVTRFEYDEFSRVSRIVRPSGRLIEYGYDAVGRVVNVRYDDELESNYSFDPNGRLVSADNGQCVVSFEYDQVGRLVHECQGQRELWHEYDESSRRVSRRTESEETTRYVWNANDRIERIVTDSFEDVVFSYDAQGIEKNRQFGSILNFESTVDARDRLISQVLKSSRDYASVKRDYTYDAADNLLRKNDSEWGVTKYVYDKLERIARTIHPDDETELFQYDPADNVVAYARDKLDSEKGAESRSLDSNAWCYSSGGLVVKQGSVEYYYDDDGRLVRRRDSSGETKYVWNAADQLVGLDNGEGDRWIYEYDALNRRVSKTGVHESRRYVWDGDVVLKEYRIGDGRDDKIDRWEYHPHDFSPLYKIQDDKQYFALNDQIGSPLELVDRYGDIVWSMRSYTFGECKRLKEGGTHRVECNIRFQGQWFDRESGLHYSRNRYYSPEMAAFISNDPIGLQGGVNSRIYAPNTTAWVDPLGLAAKPCSLDREEPRIEDGNTREGWQHIDERHVSGTSPHGPGDLFAPGTTRAQITRAAEVLVSRGCRLTDPSRRVQTYEKRIKVNGQRDRVRVIVDSQDSNRVITIFPVRSE